MAAVRDGTFNVVRLTRSLVDIDSTTGREREAGRYLVSVLRDLGYAVVEQPVEGDRVNLIATCGHPRVVFSTHYDCVPPFFPSTERDGLLYGRGTCDAKGILAAQLAASEALRDAGETRVGLLFVVGEERGSDGARAANQVANDARYLVNGEPTDNRLGTGTRGVLRTKLRARGRAAHSAYPELGESAIDKLVDALVALREVPLPEDRILGKTHYSVGIIAGGIAPNVVSPSAEAEILFRTVSDASELRERLQVLSRWVDIEDVLELPVVRLATLPGFDTEAFPFTTDIAMLSQWGTPLLLGPGSVHVAHTDHEHVRVVDLERAVDLYRRLATTLLERC